jgi:hypothetical protein
MSIISRVNGVQLLDCFSIILNWICCCLCFLAFPSLVYSLNQYSYPSHSTFGSPAPLRSGHRNTCIQSAIRSWRPQLFSMPHKAYQNLASPSHSHIFRRRRLRLTHMLAFQDLHHPPYFFYREKSQKWTTLCTFAATVSPWLLLSYWYKPIILD